MRLLSRPFVLQHRPWPTYWQCIIDTGKKFVRPNSNQVFYQNFDEEFYAEMESWCEKEFSRQCRISYNEFYFRTEEELGRFIKKWKTK